LQLEAAVRWRVASDGIALANESGRTIAFFSLERARYVLRRTGYPSVTLTREATRKRASPIFTQLRRASAG
jgi:hypothetical protein